jgi:hypothetical protein
MSGGKGKIRVLFNVIEFIPLKQILTTYKDLIDKYCTYDVVYSMS